MLALFAYSLCQRFINFHICKRFLCSSLRCSNRSLYTNFSLNVKFPYCDFLYYRQCINAAIHQFYGKYLRSKMRENQSSRYTNSANSSGSVRKLIIHLLFFPKKNTRLSISYRTNIAFLKTILRDVHQNQKSGSKDFYCHLLQ